MRCECGAEAAAEFTFCPRCGRRPAGACPACGAPCRPEGDRRPVTVVFPGVCGFTAPGERLDPEDVRAFQSELFAELAAAVKAYGGFVEEYVGDVGRADELDALEAAFERARAGGGQIVSLIGEPGVGKSGLRAEFVARLEAGSRLAGVAVRHATCSALSPQAYGVLAAFVREAYGLGPDEPVPVVRERLGRGRDALGLDAAERSATASLLEYVVGLAPELLEAARCVA